MNLLRTRGLDLPVLPGETPVLYTKDEFIEAAAQGAASFVRGVAVDIPASLTLQGALDETKEQFSIIGELTRTIVVDHEWGLVRKTPENTLEQRFGRSGEHLIPKGHVLVASVEVIQGETMDPCDASTDPLTKELEKSLDSYVRTYRGKYYLGDISVGQFVLPSALESTGNQLRPVLVDIEPRLAKQRFSTRFMGRTAPPPSEGMLWI